MSITDRPLFDRLSWRDPVSGRPLEPLVCARTPGGGPLSGALRIAGTDTGYPIVDSVARVTVSLAERHAAWLALMGLKPPTVPTEAFQPEATVESFGWQWAFSPMMRSEADLAWRVAARFGIDPASFAGERVLDAGAGAGDQSAYLLRHGAEVVSIDLSSAIDVTAGKLRLEPGWIGVQGDVTALPFASGQFDAIYCEGVLQHTRDTPAALRELARGLRPGGRLLATHYVLTPPRSRARAHVQRLRLAYLRWLRDRLWRLDRYPMLFACGILAALARAPLLGRVLRWTETALWYPLQPDFRTTWTNTYDFHGTHHHQRLLVPEAFVAAVAAAGLRPESRGPGVVVATKGEGR